MIDFWPLKKYKSIFLYQIKQRLGKQTEQKKNIFRIVFPVT